ncbi:hypothetical protein NG819_06305 [Pseudarthrobacter sp. Fe7]|nr:hypothetical protein NG819_06305 [Pseudarthrobacter sp. Fe7]
MATSAVELERLVLLEERAVVHGLDCERVDRAELNRREPNVRGLGALFIPSTGIVDYPEVARKLAEIAGMDIDVQIIPFRGEYFELPDTKSDYVSHLTYPVPDPTLAFLGVHLTTTINGGITVGPNAVLGLAREGYPKFSVDLKDVGRYLRFPGCGSG